MLWKMNFSDFTGRINVVWTWFFFFLVAFHRVRSEGPVMTIYGHHRDDSGQPGTPVRAIALCAHAAHACVRVLRARWAVCRRHATVGRHRAPRLPAPCATPLLCQSVLLAVCILALCAHALPVRMRSPLRVPAARALAVRARAVRFRAGRVVCLSSVRLNRADFARRRCRHHFQGQGRKPSGPPPSWS